MNMNDNLITDIPLFENWSKIEPIGRGWTTDRKYYVETAGRKKLLIRLCDISKYEQKKQEFEALTKIAGMGIPTSQPLEFGICDSGKCCYTLLTWLEGEDADSAVRRLPAEEDREIGRRAGALLRKIHLFPAPDGLRDKEEQMRAEFEARYPLYQACGIRSPHDEDYLRYIREHFGLLRGVKRCFLHGDFRVGNMIVDERGNLSVIDVNRWRYGDPYWDFKQMAIYSRESSTDFCQGQLEGYFQGQEPPEEFFQRMLFYTAWDMVFEMLSAVSVDEEAIRHQIRHAESVWRDFDELRSPVPIWWRSQK